MSGWLGQALVTVAWSAAVGFVVGALFEFFRSGRR